MSGGLICSFYELRVVRIGSIVVGIGYCFQIPVLFFDSFEVFVQGLHESFHSLHCGKSLGESFFDGHCGGFKNQGGCDVVV